MIKCSLADPKEKGKQNNRERRLNRSSVLAVEVYLCYISKKEAQEMKNTTREKMLRGEKTLGTFLELGSATVAECLGLGEMDYCIIDTEHGPFDPLAALDFIRAARLYGMTPFARTQEISRAAILKLLDAGAQGLIIPCVNTVEEAEAIVRYGKYGPVGERGVANAAGTGFWYEDYAQHGLPHYFEVSNREAMLIPQCETLGCLEHLEEIVRMDGIDGIFVGPFDLSTAMGIPGEFDRPEFQEALRHIQRTCAEAGKPSLIFAGTEEAARADFAMGYDSVAYGMDATILVNACRAARKNILG
jgi:4-hydroxy-2-oxoheptanedioate aldolase